MSKLFAVLVSTVFVLTAFVGIVPVAEAAVQSLSATDILRRFGIDELPLATGIEPRFDRLGINPDRQYQVMIKLPGDPVAVIQAGMPDHKLRADQKEAIKRDLKARQDAMIPSLEALGGSVVGQYQVAYNGIKIDITGSRLAALAELAGVIDVSPVRAFEVDHTSSVPLIGTPAVWDGLAGFHGEGIKIAIIDTGIDYTHANFGGPGTVAAFLAADAKDRKKPDPALFGPNAPKVKGGIDLVGDAYNGDNRPRPDPNPLDCDGHGSHVAGSAAGFGVTATGATYPGPYNAGTFSASFRIGPGVAPLADLYAIRVFGCTGFTRVTVDAIEWAVDHDMDVINMSLGSSFGLPDSSSAEASNNAAAAGVVVVASAGNNGPSPYITGAPAVADRAISVAASDSTATFPGANVALSTSQTITALNANGAVLPSGPFDVAVLRTSYPSGPVSLGCLPADYEGFPGTVVGKLVVTLRGTCARVARAIFGEQAGAAAVAMINTDAGFPPFEGPITSNPDTGIPFTVTIPFLGVRGVLASATSDGSKVVAAGGGTATLSATTITNPSFKAFAGFTSGGPRSGDGALKPDVTAPGVSIQSTAVGTGNQGTRISGTSMSSPHVAGVAALVRQAHPTWNVEEIKAAIMNTGSPTDVSGYLTRRGGTGLVQPAGATKTSVIAFFDEALVSQSFGFKELKTDFVRTEKMKIENKGTSSAMFTLAAAGTLGTRPHTITFGTTTVTVPAGGTVEVPVTFTVPVATVGNSDAFRQVVGLITLTPMTGSNSGIALRVPYYLVPRALADVKAGLSEDFGPDNPSGMVTLTNPGGPIAGDADFYAWGLKDKNEELGEHDLRAVGVQSFPAGTIANPTRRLLVFAVNTFQKWSNAAVNEFDILLDVNADGIDDFAVVGVDFGAVTAGVFNGVMGAFVFNLAVPGAFSIAFFASAPTDSSTILLPVLSTQIGVSPANPRFSYHAESFDLRGVAAADAMPGLAKFNAYTPAISNGQFIPVAPGATAMTAVTINTAEWTITPALGLMIVVLDNSAGSVEARLLEVDSDSEASD